MASRHRRHGLPSSRTRPRASPGSRHPQPRDQSLHSSNRSQITERRHFQYAARSTHVNASSDDKRSFFRVILSDTQARPILSYCSLFLRGQPTLDPTSLPPRSLQPTRRLQTTTTSEPQTGCGPTANLAQPMNPTANHGSMVANPTSVSKTQVALDVLVPAPHTVSTLEPAPATASLEFEDFQLVADLVAELDLFALHGAPPTTPACRLRCTVIEAAIAPAARRSADRHLFPADAARTRGQHGRHPLPVTGSRSSGQPDPRARAMGKIALSPQEK